MPERLIANVNDLKLIVLMLLTWAARLSFKTNLTVGVAIRQLIMSMLIGLVASEYIAGDPFAEWQNTALFCGAVFLSDDILVMLLAFGEYAKTNQTNIFKKLSKWLSGR